MLDLLTSRAARSCATVAALACLTSACGVGSDSGTVAGSGSRTAVSAAAARPERPPPPYRREPVRHLTARDASAATVLRAWDESRAAAYAAGDEAALRGLYVPGATAARADLRVLRAYERRGLRVEGMATQLLAVAVLARRPGWLRLRVVDRLVGAEAVDVAAGGRTALPRDRPTERVVELRRLQGGWRVAAVEELRG